MTSIERQSIRAIKIVALTRLTSQVIVWGITLLVMRILSPGDYGLVAIVTATAAIISTLADLGLGAAVVQGRELDADTTSKLAGFAAILHASLAAATYFAAPLLAWLFRDLRLIEFFQFCSLQFVLAAFSTIPQAVASRELRYGWLGFVELSGALSAASATLYFAYSGAQAWSLVWGSFAGAFVRTILLVWKGPFVKPNFILTGIRSQLVFGLQITLSRMVWTIVSQADIIIGGRVLDKSSLGAYSVAVHLATLPMNKIMGAVTQVAFSAFSRMQDEDARALRRVLDAARLLALLIVPVSWGMSSVSNELVLVVLGDQWRSAITPLMLIGLAVPIRVVASIFNTAAMATGKSAGDLHYSATSLVVYGSSFAIGSYWGSTGLAAGWVVAVVLMLLINFPRIARWMGTSSLIVFASVKGPLTAGVLMYSLVAVARHVLNGSGDSIVLIASIAIGAVVYIGAITFFDRQVWSLLRHALRSDSR